MVSNVPTVMAFDFDGVICDGLIEYFQTAWRAYCQLYDPACKDPADDIAERFYRLRPVIETGWEMPIVIQAMVTGRSDAEILTQWPQLAIPLLEKVDLTVQDAAKAVDGVRDTWIKTDLEGWLALHRFYPNLLEVLQRAIDQMPTYIVSTKEGRFIQQLLHQNGVEMNPANILGKEVKQPKYKTLRHLLDKHSEASNPLPQIWFVEDRIKALQSVHSQSDLASVTLFLADWGYNLEPDRETARQDAYINLLTPQKIVQEFSKWLS